MSDYRTENLPIFRRQDLADIKTPFEGDLFKRRQLAERLTAFINRLPDGGVVSIDAAWGEGKTWFAKHWTVSLKESGFRAIYIDAFRHDYVEDPFVLISGEILALAKKDNSTEGTNVSQKLTKATKNVAKALLPVAAKVAIGAASNLLLGSVGALKNIQEEIRKAQAASGEAAEKHIEKRLGDYEEDKQSVEGFKFVLSELANAHDKPIIVLIDELDRCKPPFAVQMIERIKHFFDVPKVVFVLFVKRDQLLESVKGIYGYGIDANSYVGKFIQFSLTLPKERSIHYARDANRIYGEHLLRQYGFEDTEDCKEFNDVFTLFASVFHLTLRDVERGVVMFSLAQPIHSHVGIAAWLIALKIAKPDLFDGVVRNQIGTHSQIVDLLKKENVSESAHVILGPLIELHSAHANDFKGPMTSISQGYFPSSSSQRELEDIMQNTLKKIDLSVMD